MISLSVSKLYNAFCKKIFIVLMASSTHKMPQKERTLFQDVIPELNIRKSHITFLKYTIVFCRVDFRMLSP